MVDLRQSQNFANFLQTLGWKVDHGIYIRPLWIFGAIAKIRRGKLSKNWKAVLKKHHVWFLSIDNSPTKTLRIDLYDIRPKKDCRYILRKFSNSNFQFSMNFQTFYEIFKKSAKRKNLWIPSQKEYFNLIKCFKNKCFCVTIDDQAGAFVLIHDRVAYYYYAGATAEGTKQNLPYLVVWKCMLEAKKRKCKLWDFEGIYDERHPNKDWLGFSHFKKSFGGQEAKFLGPTNKYFWEIYSSKSK